MTPTAWLAAMVIAQAQPAWTVSFTVEPTRESLRYRFENPSRLDSNALVPHFFEQTYDTRNIWAGLRLGHPLFRRAAEMRIAVTPQATRQADDFDTFFQPDGNVVVAGTTGNASVRSWQISERIEADRVRGFDVGGTFAYRRDAARYHEGIGIVTTSRPQTEERRRVTTREFVTSQLFEAGVFGARSGSTFSGSLDVIAVGVGRLAVQLPDKYPGRTIVATGRYSAAMVEASYARGVGPALARVGFRAGASLPWRRSSAMHLRRVSVFLGLGSGR